MDWQLRDYASDDLESVIALWQACALTRPWNDPRRDVQRALDARAGGLLVAASGATVLGSVVYGYDGHRGWLYYLATAPGRRGEGIGQALVAEAEARLIARGCPKVELMIRADNAAVLGFYSALGYGREDVVVAGKRLIPDG